MQNDYLYKHPDHTTMYVCMQLKGPRNYIVSSVGEATEGQDKIWLVLNAVVLEIYTKHGMAAVKETVYTIHIHTGKEIYCYKPFHLYVCMHVLSIIWL